MKPLGSFSMELQAETQMASGARRGVGGPRRLQGNEGYLESRQAGEARTAVHSEHRLGWGRRGLRGTQCRPEVGTTEEQPTTSHQGWGQTACCGRLHVWAVGQGRTFQ